MIFLHRGKCGDIIALGAFLKQEYDKTGQTAQIYVRQHQAFHKQDVDWLRPLLLTQPYYKKIDVCNTITDVYPNIPQVDKADLKLAQYTARKYNYYTGWWVDDDYWWSQVGAPHRLTDLRYRFTKAYKKDLPQTMPPWMSLPKHQRHIKEPYILINITPRYRCCVDFHAIEMLMDKYKIIFAGQPHDYMNLASGISQYYPVNSSVELAQLVDDAQLVIGTQSLIIWLAQALGKDRIVSVSNVFLDTHLRVTEGFKGAFTRPDDLRVQLYSWEYYKGKQPSVGYVIGTYGSPAYIDLQLALHKGKYNHDVIVSDDGSRNKQLQEVCTKWNVPLYGCFDERRGHQNGDLQAYIRGIDYFKDKDWVVKISRRCIWTEDLQPSIIKHSNPLWKPVLTDWWMPHEGIYNALTTACIALHRSSFTPQLMNELRSAVMTMKVQNGKLIRGSFVQPFMYQLYSRYYGECPFERWQQVYKQTGRQQFVDSILWKTSPIQKTVELSNQLGFSYTAQDFEDKQYFDQTR